MRTLARACALVCALGLGVSLPAQAVTPAAPAAPAATAGDKTAADALKLRSDIANAVFGGDTQPDAALGQLRAATAPSGLQVDPDADFAYAAIDVGQRLIVLGKPVEAEKFFQAAELSLVPLVARPANAPTKAQYLRKLSLIRGNYLNKADQAKADLEQAIALQPDDKGLQRARQVLADSHAPITLPATPKG